MTAAQVLFEAAKDLFEQEKYIEAKGKLEAAKQDPSAGPIQSELDMWIRKCNTHPGVSSVTTLPPAAPAVSVPPTVAAAVAPSAAAESVSPSAFPKKSVTRPFEWKQTANDVTLTFFYSDRKVSDVKAELDKRNLSVTIQTASGSEFQHSSEGLSAAVKGQPLVQVFPSRVEVILKKAAPFSWATLTAPKVPSVAPPVEPNTVQVAAEAPPAPVPQPPAAPVQQPPPAAPTTVAAPRFEWFQSANEVTLTFFVKDRKAEDVTHQLNGRSLSVTITLASGAPYTYETSLFADVQQTAVRVSVRSMKVEVILQKAEPYQWASLQTGASGVVTNTAPPGGAPNTAAAVPATAKDLKYPNSKGKDWNKVQFNPEDEYKAEGGDAALNALFKQVYSNGSDEQRMAMMKSFQESGGTVLSTNWADVGSKTVKPEAPRGMEEKKYGS